jgi:hypothetical protein
VVVGELVVPHVSEVPPIEVVTGSTAELPRVSEDLCPDQARLVRFAEWHMELWIKDDFNSRFCALSQADQGMLGRMLNTSRFDAEFKKMRKAFAAGLLREVEVD